MKIPSRWAAIFRPLLAASLALAIAPAPAAAQPDPVTVRAEASADRVAPGGRLVIAVTLDHEPHYHTWPAAPVGAEPDVLPAEIAGFAIRTEISLVEPPAWGTALPIQWPTPSPAPVPNLGAGEGTIDVLTYQGEAVAFVPILIDEGAPEGEATLRIKVVYQACDDTSCLMPQEETLSVATTIAAGASATGPDELADGAFAGFDWTRFDAPPVESAAPAAAPDPAPTATGAEGEGGAVVGAPRWSGVGRLAIVILLSLAGGFVLNLTPCVLPVIPIKIMTLSQHAGDRARTLYLGFWMAAGVVAFWLGIGLPAAFVSGFADPSQIFGIWWITFGIGVLIALLALGMFGLFSLNLPRAVYAVNPKASTPGGSFLFGVMTGVLGLPCFGFVAGALLPAAAAWSPYVVVSVFTAIGVGMASPYLLLAAKPGLIERVPRTGPASELVKQVMGLLLLAAAAYFVGSGLIGLVSEQPWMGKMLHWWAVAIFAALAGLWLIVRTFQISKRPAPRAAMTVLALALGSAATLYAMDATATAKANHLDHTWRPYTPEAFAQARSEGKVIVVDFTAEWCINCKALKAAVLNKEPVKSALQAGGVIAMTGDVTSNAAPARAFMDELGQTGIPLLVIWGPGLDEPWMSNAYTGQQVVAAIERAAERELAAGPP